MCMIIFGYLLLRCSFDPFKCLVVMVLSCCIKNILFSLYSSFKCWFVTATFRWRPSLRTIRFGNVTIQDLLFYWKCYFNNWFINLFRLFICWYIVCTNMNYKVLWVFHKRRFDLALHHTITPWKFFSCTLQFSSECKKSYFLICLTMLQPRIITFFVCSEVSSFHAVASGRFLPSFFDECFPLFFFLKWCTQTIASLAFFTNFFSQFVISVCSYNYITIFFVINCHFISFELLIAVFDWFHIFYNWFKWIIYIWTDQIDIFSAFFI